ncbi:SDR family oxidoreductase [Crateriforma conspicua]|nr:SDR family oxidoreductase [Crateriforma conspicua]
MTFQVDGKVVLITGANRGIGRVILNEAIARGAAKVYTAVRRLESVDELVQQHGDRVVPVALDLSKPETIEAAADTASDVDLVVNNAGVLKNATPLADDVVDCWLYESNINVVGLMRMAKAFAPVLKANGGGAFVQLNSVASMQSFTDFCTYAASKAASYLYTQALRDELSQQETAVVSVHPGPIDTDMAHDAGLQDMTEPPQVVADAIFDALAEGRFHAFPDKMARQTAEAYGGYIDAVVGDASLPAKA